MGSHFSITEIKSDPLLFQRPGRETYFYIFLPLLKIKEVPYFKLFVISQTCYSFLSKMQITKALLQILKTGKPLVFVNCFVLFLFLIVCFFCVCVRDVIFPRIRGNPQI